jgi:poly-gamma-glutamate capsule biosynthesis protein CapA/YwtB (metallophosphatase superfamily)
METGVIFSLTGDVMLGRGIDQVLPHPGDPHLYESWIDRESKQFGTRVVSETDNILSPVW